MSARLHANRIACVGPFELGFEGIG